MAILITGGCGYIGSHTCLEMLAAGYDIVVLDNYYNAKPEALHRVQSLAGKIFPFYECDIRDADGLRRIFRENQIDAVIHFAGLLRQQRRRHGDPLSGDGRSGLQTHDFQLLRHRLRHE